MAEPIQVDDVEEILDLMEQWGIAEVHLNIEGDALDLVRRAAYVPAPAHAAPGAAAAAVEALEEESEYICAPAVGVFHLAHRGFPHGEPRPGDQVQAGQLIGTIELMHVPNDLVSPVSGTIESILADDGAGVEYGQPLMSIRPYEEVSEDEAGMLPPPR
ncbi:MAG: acetyl-CoA carboxylase biotin carboxyl carrier protein [Armatimonadota bacterium]